jgi:hypothetical protein
MASRNYEIRVVGAVSPEVLLDYDRLNVDQEAGIVLLGPLPDQAALCRLLDRLEFYGIQIHEVRRISETGHAALPHHPAA